MRGYTAGKKLEPVIQLIYVECAGVQDAKDAELSIDYVSFSGVMNYYQQEEGKDTGTMILDLNQVVTDISYPVFEPVEGLIQKQDVTYTAISENIISLLDVQRTETGFDFTWGNFNPTEFALTIHIGNPPVIGDDGIIYGYYQIMDLATTPLTPAGGNVEWVTQATVPSTVKGCYILLSVESKNMRNYLNYAIDITDK